VSDNLVGLDGKPIEEAPHVADCVLECEKADLIDRARHKF
jgi:hypothetical protein